MKNGNNAVPGKILLFVENFRRKSRVLGYWFLNVTLGLINRIVYWWLYLIIVQTNSVQYLQKLKKRIQKKRDEVYPHNKTLTGVMMESDGSNT